MTMREFLDALSAELTARGVPHDLIDSQPEREPGAPPYITVSDKDGRDRRIRVHPAYYWYYWGSDLEDRYYWGSDLEDRWSALRPDVAGEVIARRALQTGWPDSPSGDLTLPLRPDNG
jgi:hypothetical protein